MTGSNLILEFGVNAYAFENFTEGEVVTLTFSDCWRYRLGPTNDEGWYRSQCRFSHSALAWGEFYEVSGELLMDQAPKDWVILNPEPPHPTKHYLFYLRDESFECDASGWSFSTDVKSS